MTDDQTQMGGKGKITAILVSLVAITGLLVTLLGNIDVTFETQCDMRKGFFIFFACNPLKRLDSEKEMKGNESNFPFVSFHFLAFAFAAGSSIRRRAPLVWTMNGIHNHTLGGGAE